ncbi:hypothetical protein SSX86_026210 [Deinandra increscens subsp. villosa]|uniref:Uncharacterized protein n=1 Tax=Deinandra increscens subsp. villosa TaxID=3103831 RepID=A0AAP0CHQ5_9ASTR
MKPSHVIALLILSTLLYEAQGINRKLMTKATSSTTISKNYKNDESKDDPQAVMKFTQENFKVSSSSQRLKDVIPQRQDVIDLAAMDYAPAKRKTPIHN